MTNQQNHKTHKRKTRAASTPVVDPKDVSVRGAVVVVEETLERKKSSPGQNINPIANPGDIDDETIDATLAAEDSTPGEDNPSSDDSSNNKDNSQS